MISSTVMLDFENNRCRDWREDDDYSSPSRIIYPLSRKWRGFIRAHFREYRPRFQKNTANTRVNFLIKKVFGSLFQLRVSIAYNLNHYFLQAA